MEVEVKVDEMIREFVLWRETWPFIGYCTFQISGLAPFIAF